ncbi:MAG TPA: helix-turn-helix domain-containing protein [Caulobacteraceae bacterium]|nr:helix-turn-helix domain-containing protein [Caulobacteraceae bacterium]
MLSTTAGLKATTSSRLEVKVKLLDIAEVARSSGMAASRLRFYEEKGLIASIGRRGLKRLFDAGVLDRLALIALGQTAGFSLDEIAGMLGADDKPRIDRAQLSARANQLDQTIRRFESLRDGLRHAAACPAPSHMECPTFQRILKAAVARTRRPAATASRPRPGSLLRPARPRAGPPGR